MKAIELFAGAGGLALGIERAGFRHILTLDHDSSACKTLALNFSCEILEKDAAQIDYSKIESGISLLAGGPPCQPFSSAGKHGAATDSRNGFPEAIRALESLNPKAFIFENVSGLLRKNWNEYVEYIERQLSQPFLPKKPMEHWYEHSNRLAKEYLRKAGSTLQRYQVYKHLVNAADYGVPQNRSRVIFIGFRRDIDAYWMPPEPTHSEESLLSSKWMNGTYWIHHNIEKPIISAIDQRKLKRMQEHPELLKRKRWKTVRDVVRDLGEPIHVAGGYSEFEPHAFIPGAKSYPGHTGSHIDQPSKAIKSGVNGVGGGENMIRLLDDSVRYFSILELLTLQSFPESYKFYGNRSSVTRQIGNAVPPKLAYVFAKQIRSTLLNHAK